jgi:DNA-binding MarR family transcriptional regulator
MKSSSSKTARGRRKTLVNASKADLKEGVDAIGRAWERGPGRALEHMSEAIQRAAWDPEHVDRALAQWKRELPDVDTRGSDVLNRLRRITLESRPAIEANFRHHGLDTGEFDVLASLRRSGPPYALRPTELYVTLMISSGGMTARLDRLEGLGFIRRRRADDDRRSIIVELTPAGKKKIEAAFRDDMEIENRMLADFSEKDRTDLIRLLRKLAHAMRR